jgi:hypothetical protein
MFEALCLAFYGFLIFPIIIRGRDLFSGDCLHLLVFVWRSPNPAGHVSKSPVFLTTSPLTHGAHWQDPQIRPNPTFWASSLAGCSQNRCPLRSEYDSTAYLYKPGYSLAIGLLEPRWGLRQEPGI